VEVISLADALGEEREAMRRQAGDKRRKRDGSERTAHAEDVMMQEDNDDGDVTAGKAKAKRKGSRDGPAEAEEEASTGSSKRSRKASLPASSQSSRRRKTVSERELQTADKRVRRPEQQQAMHGALSPSDSPRAAAVDASPSPSPPPPPPARASTPSHLLPLAPASPFLSSPSQALVPLSKDGRVRDTRRARLSSSRRSLPAPAARLEEADEEEDDERTAREERVRRLLEKGLGTEKPAESRRRQQEAKEKEEKAQHEEKQAAAAAAAAGVPAAGDSNGAAPNSNTAAPTFTFPSMLPPAPASAAVLSQPAAAAANTAAQPVPLQQPVFNSGLPAPFPSLSPAPVLNPFTSGSVALVPPPAVGAGTPTPFGFPSSASPPPFGAFPAQQPLQPQVSVGSAGGGDGFSAGFKAPSRNRASRGGRARR
jgi:hypothetical protein